MSNTIILSVIGISLLLASVIGILIFFEISQIIGNNKKTKKIGGEIKKNTTQYMMGNKNKYMNAMETLSRGKNSSEADLNDALNTFADAFGYTKKINESDEEYRLRLKSLGIKLKK